jgi:hypothetical protein
MGLLILRSSVVAQGGDELSHGDTWTINGSGFGTAPTAAFLQPTIEATGVGNNISLSSPFGVPDAPIAIYQGYDDATRGRAIRAQYIEGSNFDLSLLWDPGSNIATNGLQYVTWWVRAQTRGPNIPAEEDDDGGTTFPSGEEWQWKLWRFRANDSVNDIFSTGDLMSSHWDNSDGSYMTGGPDVGGPAGAGHYINGVGGSQPGFDDPPPFVNNVSGRRAGGDDLPTLYRDHWFRVEVFFSAGSGATGAVRVRVWHEDPGELRHVANSQGVNWLASHNFRYFIVQNWLGNADGPGQNFTGTWIAVDDFYGQRGNLRRVMLTPSATLSLTDWREQQLHTTWSNTQITGVLNVGANRTGTCYLHVIETDITTGNDTSLGSVEVEVV